MKPIAAVLASTLLSVSLMGTAHATEDKLCPDPLFGGSNLEEWQGDEVLLQLDLNGTQQQRIDHIKDDHERARTRNLHRLAELQRQIDTLSPTDPGFDTAIDAIARERAELVGEQVRQRIRMVAAVQATLSPEQRVVLERKMTERMRRREFIENSGTASP